MRRLPCIICFAEIENSVVLAFTRSGNHLIAYRREPVSTIESENNVNGANLWGVYDGDRGWVYLFELWRFDFARPLKRVRLL